MLAEIVIQYMLKKSYHFYHRISALISPLPVPPTPGKVLHALQSPLCANPNPLHKPSLTQ